MSIQTRLFVGNIPECINDITLRGAFSSYGEIINLELKSKPGAENDKRFAFITLSASNYDVESCIKNFSNLDFDGHRLYVTRARESFLERLQRERELASKKDDEKRYFDEAEPKEIPVINLSSKLNHHKRKFDVSSLTIENNYIENTKNYKKDKKITCDFQSPSDSFIGTHKDFDNNDKKQNSEKKRLESLKKKRQEFKEKRMIIKTGLEGIDKVKNKRVFFSDNEEESLHDSNSISQETIDEKQANVKKNTLFDDDESDTEVNFEIKKQFEGKKGQKVLDLQSRYKSDKRFTLDERFVDEDQSDAEKEHDFTTNYCEEIEIGQSDEKFKQLNILQDLLGVTIKMNNSDSTQKTKPKLGMLRYDPTQPDHAKYLAQATTFQEIPKKLKKKNSKEIQAVTTEPESFVEKVEVSKEQFYKVSETLKEAMIQPSSFSLRSLFAKEENDVKEPIEQSMGHECLTNEKKSRNPLDPGEKNPFVYDSSDSECEENKDDINILQEKSEIKAVWRENFFFSKNDYRLKEGLLFFNKYYENEGQKERRGLKSIMKKRIYNKERKTQLFQKKIGEGRNP